MTLHEKGEAIYKKTKEVEKDFKQQKEFFLCQSCSNDCLNCKVQPNLDDVIYINSILSTRLYYALLQITKGHLPQIFVRNEEHWWDENFKRFKAEFPRNSTLHDEFNNFIVKMNKIREHRNSVDYSHRDNMQKTRTMSVKAREAYGSITRIIAQLDAKSKTHQEKK